MIGHITDLIENHLLTENLFAIDPKNFVLKI